MRFSVFCCLIRLKLLLNVFLCLNHFNVMGIQSTTLVRKSDASTTTVMVQPEQLMLQPPPGVLSPSGVLLSWVLVWSGVFSTIVDPAHINRKFHSLYQFISLVNLHLKKKVCICFLSVCPDVLLLKPEKSSSFVLILDSDSLM